MRTLALVGMLLTIGPVAARADLQKRSPVDGAPMQATITFNERFGTGQQFTTAKDARIGLYGEIAAECGRIERVLPVRCQLRAFSVSPEAAGTDVHGQARYELKPKADRAARSAPDGDFWFGGSHGGLF